MANLLQGRCGIEWFSSGSLGCLYEYLLHVEHLEVNL